MEESSLFLDEFWQKHSCVTYQKYSGTDHVTVQVPYPLKQFKTLVECELKVKQPTPFFKHKGRMKAKQMETILHVIIEFEDNGSGVGIFVLCVISDIFPSSVSSRLVSVSSGRTDCGFPTANSRSRIIGLVRYQYQRTKC